MGNGKGRRDGGVWLAPEEGLYLLERGTLDLRWGKEGEVGLERRGDAGEEGRKGVEGESESTEENPGMVGLPVSLQAGFAFLIGVQGLTLERYTVYVTLKRAGFVVKRAPTWHDDEDSTIGPDGSEGREEGEGEQDDDDPNGLHPRAIESEGGSGDSIWQSMWNAVFERRRRRAREQALRHGPLVGKGLYRSYSPSSPSPHLSLSLRFRTFHK